MSLPIEFKEGRNCWRIARSDRIAVLVDGESYFDTLRHALQSARRRISIIGWDIHSRIELTREPVDDDLPTTLADLLGALLARTPELEVRVLLWSYAPIYALEREPLFFGNHPWERHPRLHFALDDSHPLAASHHQKLVVIDGALAFCGGFDLGKWRWDTNEHLSDDPGRVDPEGHPYPPFHDLQMVVDADAAAALDELAMSRWRHATGETLEPCASIAEPPWPECARPMLRGRDCAIARTQPAHGEREEVREVERLYLDLLAGAERLIYLENQYLTSSAIQDILRERLSRTEGPEIVIVLPRETGAWLEQHTMDILRARVLEDLRAADRHGRLRVYYPQVPGLDQDCLMVHAKLAIIDDRWLRIGSANLSNRSMGLDTECDLCVGALDDADRHAIADLRRRLLGMFLAVTPEAVEAAEQHESGLIDAIEALRGPHPESTRTLVPLSTEVDPEWKRQLPDARLVDPDRPLSPFAVGDAMVGRRHLPRARRRLWLGGALVVTMVLFALAWRWTGLGALVEPQALADALTGVLHGPAGPFLLIAGFVLGSLIAIPVSLLIVVTAIIFGPWLGALYALLGSVLAAVASYALGAYLGRPTVERLGGGRIHRLSERLARRGILTIVAVRIIPVAPFTVLNLLAGASHIRLRDFAIGTFIGMIPGVVAIAAFAKGLMALVRDANLQGFLLAALAFALLAGISLLVRRWLTLGESEREGG